MTDLLQPGQHPDADQLNAFAEDVLPAHERQQTLAHLAACPHCRTIVSLSLLPVEEVPTPLIVPARKPWFQGWNMLWLGGAALASLVVLTIHLHRTTNAVNPSSPPTQMADARPPAPLPTPPPAAQPSAKTPLRKAAKPQLPATTTPAAVVLKTETADGIITGKDIENLPLNGRNYTQLDKAKSLPPTSFNGPTAGGPVLAQPSANQFHGQIAYSAQPSPAPPAAIAGAAGKVSGAIDVVSDSATVDTSNLNQQVSNMSIASLSTTDLTPAKPYKLPSKLAVASVISRADQTLALDTAGALFLSTDSGHHWKSVSTPWAGRAVKVTLAAFPVDAKKASAPMPVYADAARAGMSSAPSAGVALSSLSGTVTDASGAVIPGSTLIVTNAQTALTRTVRTDQAGRYLVAGLPPGSYQVAASSPGFQTQQVNVVLNASQQSTLDIKLSVGALAETVTVQSQAAVMDTETSGSARKKTLKALPHPESAPAFEITTENGDRWISIDGKTWKRN